MKVFFTLTPLLLTLLLLLSCQRSAKQDKVTLVYCSEGSPSKLNPQIVTDGTSVIASSDTVFDRLLEFSPTKGTLAPGLAERWEVSADGKEYTFYLRKNIPFHSNELFTPTRPFNADDVVFSIERMRNPKHPLHHVNGGIYETYLALGMDKSVKEVIRQGEHQVKIVLHGPEAPFLSYMALHHMSVTSKEYAEKLLTLGKPELFDMKPIGTGPFVFKKYVQDTLIRYQAFKKHFSKAPKIDHLVFSITPDSNVRFQKLKTGECHIIFEPARSDLTAMKKHNDIKIMERNGTNVGFLSMNTQKPPFDKREVRQAVNMALNKKSYIDAIYLGQATVAKNPFPPNVWSYHHEIKDYDYNPEEARKLLARAGFPQGFKTELWVLPVSRPYIPDGKKMGEMMQADLKKVGVEAKIVSYDWGTYLDKARKGEHQMIQLGWSSSIADPDNFLNVLLSCSSAENGSSSSRFCHPEFDQLVQKARILTSQTERAQLYQKAQEIFKREAPWVPIAHSIIYRAMRKNVQGHILTPVGRDHFYTISLK